MKKTVLIKLLQGAYTGFRSKNDVGGKVHIVRPGKPNSFCGLRYVGYEYISNITMKAAICKTCEDGLESSLKAQEIRKTAANSAVEAEAVVMRPSEPGAAIDAVVEAVAEQLFYQHHSIHIDQWQDQAHNTKELWRWRAKDAIDAYKCAAGVPGI